MKTKSISPPNSLILVMDYSTGHIPEAIRDNIVSATESCIAIGCRCAYDGPTTINLVNGENPGNIGICVFEGEIVTPSKILSVCNVYNEIILQQNVRTETTKLTIFANNANEPDLINIIYE